MMYPEFDESKNTWLHVPKLSTITDSWTVLIIDNGNKILSFGKRRCAGDAVHVLDSSDYEIATWSSEEISENVELSLGAIIRAAAEVQFSDER